jgi:hypothetical protein
MGKKASQWHSGDSKKFLVLFYGGLSDRPRHPLQGATERIGGYAREPEVRPTREHHRLPPAYGRYSRRAYRAHELFLFAYR